MLDKNLRMLALIALLALGGAACGGDEGGGTPEAGGEEEAQTETEAAAGDDTQQSQADGQLKIGLVLPETGDLAFLGPPEIQASQYAASLINEAGGVLGEDVTVTEGDSGSDPEGTVANQTVDRHLADNVDAIIGAAASGISLTFIDKVTSAGVIHFSPANTSPEFTDYDDNGLYFRTAPTDVLQSQVQAELWLQDGNTDMVILARADSYGRNFARLSQEAFEESGGSAEIISYDFQAQNFDAEVQQALDANPDGIAIIGFEETGRILQQLIENGAGPSDIPIYGTDGNASSTLWESVDPEDPSAVEGMKFSNPGARNEEFQAELLEFAPDLEDFAYAGESFDAITIIALATEVAGTDGGTAIAAEINGVTRDGEKCESFEDCKALIDDGQDIDYDGVSGPGEFVEAGEPSVANYQIFQANAEGQLESVDQLQVTLE